jgi:hypothetical protein
MTKATSSGAQVLSQGPSACRPRPEGLRACAPPDGSHKSVVDLARTGPEDAVDKGVS